MSTERRLTTIVAADVAGYSRLVSQDEEGTLARFRDLRRRLIDPEIAAGGGRLVKTMGDGLLVEFASPVAALRSVLAVQRTMAAGEAGRAEADRIRFRVGINLGDVVVDGDDLLGDGVNIAARLESLAPPGGICLSRAVHDQVQGKIDATLIAMGPQAVKNIPHPVDTWQVQLDDAPAPPPVTRRAEPPGIAVLPFDNLSSDPDQSFLADGIVEDVTTELSRFRTLKVVARNSAFSYRGTSRDIREIGRELDVAYVVEGSVRRAGDRLRVTAQLIEAETGSHVWADRWDRTMDDLFAVQDELTTAIVTGVEPELGAHERAVSRRKPTESLTAWELCSRGFAEFVKYTEEGYAEALTLYNRAVAIDPDFALPHAYLARWYWVQIVTGRSPEVGPNLKAGIAHAERAVELDPRLELAQAALGVLLAMAGREADAAHVLKSGIAMNPNNAILHFAQTHACLFQQEPDCDLMERSALAAIRLSPRDPLAWGFWVNLGNARLMRRFDWGDPSVLDAYLAATQQPHADYIAFFAVCVCALERSEEDRAKSFLDLALKRYPGLTMANLATAFAFPKYALYYRKFQELADRLLAVGLPRA